MKVTDPLVPGANCQAIDGWLPRVTRGGENPIQFVVLLVDEAVV